MQVLPKPPVKEQTKPEGFKLITDVRAVERAEFDEYVSVVIFPEMVRLQLNHRYPKYRFVVSKVGILNADCWSTKTRGIAKIRGGEAQAGMYRTTVEPWEKRHAIVIPPSVNHRPGPSQTLWANWQICFRLPRKRKLGDLDGRWSLGHSLCPILIVPLCLAGAFTCTHLVRLNPIDLTILCGSGFVWNERINLMQKL